MHGWRTIGKRVRYFFLTMAAAMGVGDPVRVDSMRERERERHRHDDDVGDAAARRTRRASE